MKDWADNPDISMLRNQKTVLISTFDPERRTKTIRLPRGGRAVVAEAGGSGAIVSLWMTFPGWFWQHWNPEAPVSQTILKTLVLRIYWDGCARPAVEAPACDFFGNGLCEASNFSSEYFGMSSGGFFCRFPMPFRRGFVIELENLDEQIDTEIFANVVYQKSETVSENSGYFHAQFHTARLAGPEPIEILDTRGRGHFAGCTLAMQGRDPNYLGFLEAPEHVWVDSDSPDPDFIGTGLEDYFMGGWYFREGTLSGPLHGVPSKDSLNASVAMYRVHERDAIHFQKRLKFQFIYPWKSDRLRPFVYSSVAYYYLESPEGDGPKFPAVQDLLCWYRTRNTDHISIP